MKNLVEFLQDIHHQGWQLWSENGQLFYDAPKDKLTDSILATLKQHKTEILQLLPQIEFQETPRLQPVIVPLTEAQKQFWFLDQVDENSKQAYIDQVCLQLEGIFNINAMEQAIKKIVERHEALRTRISSEGDFQEVLPEVKIEVPLINFSDLSVSDREAQVTEWLEGEIQKPFNLEEAPLWRVYILKLEEKLHRLVLRIHHIINDGLSIEIILQEIAAFYSAQCEEKVCQLEKPMQFREYIEWQNQISQTEEMAGSELYWLNKFSGSIPVLDLPRDRQRPPIMTYRGSRQTLKLDGKLLEQIKKVSKQKGCTLFMSLLAIYKIFLSKLTGDIDIVVGTPARGRGLAGSENMIGYCNNVLPIRSNIDESLTFSEFLIKIRGILLEDYQNQDYPFPQLLSKLNLERDLSRPILVSTLFNLDRMRSRPNLYGLKTKLIPIPKKFVPYDMVLDITETEDELLFNLDYNQALFEDATIKRWLGHVQTLLEEIATNPEQRVAQLPLLTVAAQQQLLEISQNSDNNNCISPLWSDNLPFYVLDGKKQLTPVGVDGEIYIAASEGLVNSCDIYEHPQLGLIRTTQQWGRRLPNGFLEWKGNIHKLVRVKGKRINLEEIEIALRSHPEVKDCHVLVREEQLVAYLEVSKALSTESILAQLKLQLPRNMQPDDYVQVSALPLTASGQIDEKTLASLEVIDSQLRDKWEEKVTSHPQIEKAAVVVLPKPSQVIPPLHILDLLPEEKIKVNSSATINKVSSEVKVTSQPEHQGTDISAFIDGGQLTIPEDAVLTLTEALIQTATQYQHKEIVYILSDKQQVSQTYSSLLTEAKCILNGLHNQGLKAGDRIILQIECLRNYFSALWGCILGGIQPVTVAVAKTYQQQNAVVKKLYNTWELLEHPAILASESLLEQLQNLPEILPMSGVQVLSVQKMRNYPATQEIYHSQPDDVAFLQLTSGSTGVPKCIQETHQGIITHIHAAQQFNGYQAEDISLNWLPVDHVVPILTSHFKNTYLGCQQIEVATDVVLANPTIWLDLIEKYRVSHTWTPNFGFKLVSDTISKVPHLSWDLSSVKFFMNAGEQVTPKVVREFLKSVASFGVPSQAMQPAFGMAEVCTCMTYQNQFDCESGIHPIRKSSIGGKLVKGEATDTDVIEFIDLGSPVPGVQIRITDENNKLLPEGVIGRFQIKGKVVTPGYLNNPQANLEAFVGDGWFNSGDLGFILDGKLVLTGREKELIIINGVNYYCYEIEDIVNNVEGVEPTFAGAISFYQQETGTEGLSIFFTPKQPKLEDNIELIKTIRGEISSQIGIAPVHIIPISTAEFPKTTSGKIQRGRLKKMLLDKEYQETIKKIDILLENNKTIPNWFYCQNWRQKEASIFPIQTQIGITLIFTDNLGLGSFLSEKLEQCNQKTVLVSLGSEYVQFSDRNYTIAPENFKNYQQLFESIAVTKIPISRILHISNYQEYTGEINSIESLEKSYNQGIYSLLYLIQELEKIQGSEHQVQLVYVSSHSHSVLPTDKIAYEKSTVLGLLKSIPQEIPWLRCRHIDLPVAAVKINGSYLWQELLDVSPAAEVAYREGKRFVSGIEPVNLAAKLRKQLPFKQGGIYLLSGGLGGIGREVAKYLLEHYQAKVILVGRTPLPDKNILAATATGDRISEKIQAYQKLQQLGTLTYQAVDICNLSQLQQIVTEALSKWGGKLDGVIHLAGVLEEQLLLAETQATVAKVLRPKVLGSWVLHQLLKENDDALFIHFASVNGFFGGASVGAYAAAHSFQTSFCDYQRTHSNLQSYCLAWSMWDETGMSQGYQMKELSRAKGYYGISPLQGMYSLLAALGHGENHLMVGLDGSKPLIKNYCGECENLQQLTGYLTTVNKTDEWAKILLPEWQVRDRFGQLTHCQWVQLEQMPETETGEIDRGRLLGSGSSSDRQQTQPRNQTERQLVAIFQEVLSISSVGIHDNFFELRGDSMKMTQVVFQVRETLNVKLPLGKLFENPTVAELSTEIEANRNSPLSLAKQLQTVSNDQEKWEEIEL
ncbi:MAG: SDR family NAD(P)-dependent oxidoreductase [Okeania sp. SIO2C9]|uniref:SDR family NAD(P)-dependent oxidoreductase n=1 Tax=Okeania sp. SIO2C9 TaxID=2607791 RepID=UPI0013BF7A28|nr:SDR family NAD(P)-dependent oxidoreductase [Okeania sp. SIO2C9]NEQ75873.1 SDR family NAD(P)-dependent oxidoreductase [Okeania sp. SIO2C9]